MNMERAGEVWRLQRHNELVGEITVDGVDFPWLEGHFEPGHAFAAVKPLFEQELALLEADDNQAWEDAYERINQTMKLIAPDGPVAEFLLHIKDERAWFRWIDEPVPKSS